MFLLAPSGDVRPAPNSRWGLLLSSWDSTLYLMLLPTGPPDRATGSCPLHVVTAVSTVLAPEATCVYTRACMHRHMHTCARAQVRVHARHARVHGRVHTQAHTHTHILRDPDGCAGYVIALPASLFLEYVAFLLPNLMGLRRLSRGSGTPASGFFIRPQFRAAAVAGVGK